MGQAVGPSSDPDAQLMVRFVAGERDCFRQLFERYAARMVAFAGRFVHDRAQAEEIAQEILFKVYRTTSYSPTARFSTWLYRIATNHCLNEVRRQERGRRPVSGGFEDDTLRHVADERLPLPEEVSAGRELFEAAQRAIDALPERQRAALILHRFENLSCKEVAQALQTSEGSVKVLINRARERLKVSLGDYLATDSPVTERSVRR